MGRNQQVGKKTEGRDDHVGKGNEDQWKILTAGFLLQLRLGSSGSSVDLTDLNDPHECDGKGSETHVPVSFQVFVKNETHVAPKTKEKAGEADSSGGVRERGKVTRRDGSGRV